MKTEECSQKCVFVWGSNEKRQLGIGEDVEEIYVPHQLDPCPFQKDGCTPKEVYAGNGYSAVLTQEGVVYTWGSGEFGRLGYCDTRRQTTPRQVSELRPHIITKLALGSYYAAAISENGLVFTWGRGNSGQLGRGNVMSEDFVNQVTSLNGVKVVDISCGDSHTCALGSDGDVYTWGAGQVGQLGHGDYLRQSLPIKVANLSEHIVQVSCGKKHTIVLSKQGQIYSWGSNEHGQLGRTAQSTTLKLSRNLTANQPSTTINKYHVIASAHTSPQTNFIQGLSHKIPLSTDNHQHRFEFPMSKGNSGDSENEMDLLYTSHPTKTMDMNLNKLIPADLNLSASLSPNQNFTPQNRLTEISPYNKLPLKYQKLELDSYSDKSSNVYMTRPPVTSQNIPRKGAGLAYGNQMDETPKYIKNLRGELNVALKQNLELRLRLDRLEEEKENGLQQKLIDKGEQYIQDLKKASRTSQIDEVISLAFEWLDSLQGQPGLKRFVKSQIESVGSLRKEVLLQAALINSLETHNK